jgi:hypothetical protein
VLKFSHGGFSIKRTCGFFSVHLVGKIVDVDVEVVYASLNYNLLLGHNWTYAMKIVVPSIFCTLCFPHEGKIVTIDLNRKLRMLVSEFIIVS